MRIPTRLSDQLALYLFFGVLSAATFSALFAEPPKRTGESAGETVLMDDPLQGQTVGTQIGGSFNAEGFLPGLGANHILYELQRTVREGYVEFEVKGMDAAAVPKDSDHAFLALAGVQQNGNL